MSIIVRGLNRGIIEQYVETVGNKCILRLDKIIPIDESVLAILDIQPCADFVNVFRSRLRKAQEKYGKIKTVPLSWLNNGIFSWDMLKYYFDYDKRGTAEFFDYLKTIDNMIETVMYEIEQQSKRAFVSNKVQNVYALLKNLITYGYTTADRMKCKNWGMLENPLIRFDGDDIILDNDTHLFVARLVCYLSYRYCCDVVMKCSGKDRIYISYFINGEKVYSNYKKVGV